MPCIPPSYREYQATVAEDQNVAGGVLALIAGESNQLVIAAVGQGADTSPILPSEPKSSRQMDVPEPPG